MGCIGIGGFASDWQKTTTLFDALLAVRHFRKLFVPNFCFTFANRVF